MFAAKCVDGVKSPKFLVGGFRPSTSLLSVSEVVYGFRQHLLSRG